jgi:5'-nucleotidase
MKLLITNDDGIDAPGIEALVEAVRSFGDGYVVAPTKCHSGCGHKLTTDESIELEERGGRRFAVAGTPADCVRLGLLEIVPDADWVIAGINAGGNLGVDIYLSGTVAAAREGAFLGVPSIAFSYYRPKGHEPDWSWATGQAERLIQKLTVDRPQAGSIWNVNFSGRSAGRADPELVECFVDPSPLPLQYAKSGRRFTYDTDYHARTRVPESDVDHCFRGGTTISRIDFRHDRSV